MSSGASSVVASQAGFTVVPGVFTGEELVSLRDAAARALQQMLTAAEAVDRDQTTAVWADGHHLQQVEGTTIHWEPHAPDVVRSVSPVTHLDARLDELWADPRVLEPACEVLGVANVTPLRCALNLKKAGVGSEYRWHQDTIAPPAVNVVVFLDEARSDNGPLCLLPGSHLTGRLPIDPTDPIGQHPDPSLIDSSDEEVITVEAGSVLAFSTLLVHRSSANRSRHDRCALRLCFQATGELQPQG